MRASDFPAFAIEIAVVAILPTSRFRRAKDDSRLIGFSPKKLATTIEGQTAALNQLIRDVSKMRHLRVSGLLLLMGLGVFVGAGAVVGIFWQSYTEARKDQAFIERVYDAGVTLRIKEIEGHSVFTVNGPPMLRGTGWRTNAEGVTTGAVFVLPKEGNQ